MTKMFVTLQQTACESLPVQLRAFGVPSSERSVQRILDVNNIKATDVLLTVNNHTCPTHVTTTGDHNNVTSVELNEIGDLVLLDIKFDGVVNPDGRVRVANSPTIVRDDVWDALRTNSHFSYLEELVASLLRCDAVNGKTTFNIVKETEVFA